MSNIKAESCYLQWDAPLDNGGSELTNYIVEKKDMEPELVEGQEAPSEPQWEEVTNCIIERKYGVCPNNNNNSNGGTLVAHLVTNQSPYHSSPG